jgi:voltage-gated potassium channel
MEMLRNREKTNAETHPSDPLTVYELFVLAITLIAMVLWPIYLLTSIDSQTKNVDFVLDSALSLFFLADFFYCFYRAENRRHYFLHRGWLDLLGSIPTLLILRPLRLARAIQIIKKMNQTGKTGVLNVVRSDLSGTVFWTTLLSTLLLLITAAMLILQAEKQAVDATITTSADALWWAISTVATVGYGDVVPVTVNGRQLGAILMTIGVLFVSVLTSYITTSLFIYRTQARPTVDIKNPPMMRRFDHLEQELAEIKRMLADKEDRE